MVAGEYEAAFASQLHGGVAPLRHPVANGASIPGDLVVVAGIKFTGMCT